MLKNRKCTNCNISFKNVLENSMYNDCVICGTELIDEIIGVDETVAMEEDTTNNIGRFLTIDNLGYVHFINEKQDDNKSVNRLLVYINNKIYDVYPIRYAETTIGRINSKTSPDVDLSDIDIERRISRNHIMLYKENNEDYIRNISSNNSVHINTEPLVGDAVVKLEDNDLIILSRFMVIKYKKAE